MTLDWLYEKTSCTTCESHGECYTELTRHSPPDYGCYRPNARAQEWHAKRAQEQVDELGAQLAANHARLTGRKP